ncbi:DUF4232 domain-containing protein [Streptomyces montanisoli]|uniref:DUF4232 domain-containing protein n=1 Tax=Streptomyces montanisoli TaxID=2798581 RepID=A0A940RT73_9ACTN|nr:DUF4232 domain-containing protein [Streptomyces montanisoli]MBP0455901.1 DUF4232 domain-containing protein [Streptomyces montanisoli]
MHVKAVRRGIPALLLAATAGLTLAACGSGDAQSSSPSSALPTTAGASVPGGVPSAPESTPTATSGSDSTGGAASTGATASVTPGGGGSGGASSGGSEPACKTSQLRITATNRSSGAGHTTFQLMFQNTGSSPCTLSGYPGVSFVKGHDTQLGKAASRTEAKVPIVTLIPDSHAYADVRTVNGQSGYSAAKCDLTTVPTLRVYPPNQKESTDIPWNEKECVGPTVQNLQVGPVHTKK